MYLLLEVQTLVCVFGCDKAGGLKGMFSRKTIAMYLKPKYTLRLRSISVSAYIYFRRSSISVLPKSAKILHMKHSVRTVRLRLLA
jgi:hypothetical protein